MATRRQIPGEKLLSPPIMAADWHDLTAHERDQAVREARHEGRRAARWYLAVPADDGLAVLSLRGSRWAQEHGGLDRLPDDVFHLYAAARTLAQEADYVEYVVEPLGPERAAAWWEREPAERQKDARVCAFCAAYERERCRILSLPEPPIAPTDLQLHLCQAQEQEREAARDWLRSTEEDGEEQQYIARWEYQRRTLASDLARMLLTVATDPSPASDISPRKRERDEGTKQMEHESTKVRKRERKGETVGWRRRFLECRPFP